MLCGSWIITSLETGKVIFETFSAGVAAKVNRDKYRVECAYSYLTRIDQTK